MWFAVLIAKLWVRWRERTCRHHRVQVLTGTPVWWTTTQRLEIPITMVCLQCGATWSSMSVDVDITTSHGLTEDQRRAMRLVWAQRYGGPPEWHPNCRHSLPGDFPTPSQN